MATIHTVTVKPSGGNYASLNAAEAGEQGDLVSLDRQLDIECYSMLDTTAVVVDGSITDSTRYIRIYTPSSQRHAGKWGAVGYRLEAAATASYVLNISDNHVWVVGLQIYQTATAQRSAVSTAGVAGIGNILIAECLLRTASTNATVSRGSTLIHPSGTLSIHNSVIYGSPIEAGIYCNGGTLEADNCTIVGNATYGVVRTSGTVTLRNCYSGGNGTDAYSGTMSLTTCAHDTATIFTGSAASIAHSTTNFANVTGGSEDYHLVSGSALIGAGADLSGTFTTDIDGTARSAPWDIGADQYVAAGGPFTQSLSGSFPAPSASLSSVVAFHQSSTGNFPSPSGGASKMIGKGVSGSLPDPSGIVSKRTSVTRTGNMPSPSGSLQEAVTFRQTVSGIMGSISAIISTVLNPIIEASTNKIKIIGSAFRRLIGG
jgi:hypothetical protein